MRRDSFQLFYFVHVAVGEACGCAEAVSRLRDIHEAADARPRCEESDRRGGRFPLAGRLVTTRSIG